MAAQPRYYGWREAASTPSEPPAPGRLSTSTGWPSLVPRILASTRAVLSVMPPGVKGTTKVMGLVGQLSPAACAAPASRAAVPIPANTFFKSLFICPSPSVVAFGAVSGFTCYDESDYTAAYRRKAIGSSTASQRKLLRHNDCKHRSVR